MDDGAGTRHHGTMREHGSAEVQAHRRGHASNVVLDEELDLVRSPSLQDNSSSEKERTILGLLAEPR